MKQLNADQALGFNPSCDEALATKAMILIFADRTEEGVTCLAKALRVKEDR